jgi:hypothetical protein
VVCQEGRPRGDVLRMRDKQQVIHVIKTFNPVTWKELSCDEEEYRQIMSSLRFFFNDLGAGIDRDFLEGIVDDYVWGF